MDKVTYQLLLTITLRYELIYKVKDLRFSELYLIHTRRSESRHMRYMRIQTTDRTIKR
jgi:hypothetical protein